jgi:formate hydrogenlyase subunit 3/multisubunit Na+/H+ antiporter MnhD subunit
MVAPLVISAAASLLLGIFPGPIIRLGLELTGGTLP